MDSLTHLYPEAVWGYFEEICKIPRPSKKEDKMIEYVLDFAAQHELKVTRDEAGNVLINKPATQGLENKKKVILQSHLDMVGEKNADVDHDFDIDSVEPFIDGNWVKANGTTLGADDGIGVAASLAILASSTIAHGPLECLFTIDEETGMTGATALSDDFMEGEILINLDSEDWGEIFIGSAGGIDTVAHFNYDTEATPANQQALKINIKGLKGGHSGDDIDKGLGNSNKILNRIVWAAQEEFSLKLARFEGGNMRNAIPREAEALVTIDASKTADFDHYFNELAGDIKNELRTTEPGLQIAYEKTQLPEQVLDAQTQRNLLNALYACPHGVYEMSREMKGLVETSTNLAAVRFKDGFIEITTSQRSSVDSAKTDIARMVSTVFRMAGAKVKHSDGYPGWKPDPESEIVKTSVESYKRLFNEEPVVRAVHAGLECGMFLSKYPHLDMVSIGPDLKGAHTPEERISIDTTGKFWELLVDMLKNVPEK